jgi:hypothetical protein
MVVTTMTILVASGIYNLVIWIIESCSYNQSQMASMISFVVVNVVVNATFWLCVYVNQYLSTQPPYFHSSLLQLLKSSFEDFVLLQEGGYFNPPIGYKLSWQT